MTISNLLKFTKSIHCLLLAGLLSLSGFCLGGQQKKSNSPINGQFRGSSALAYTKRAVSFGERPSGSDAMIKLRQWIVSELKQCGAETSVDSFTGHTPAGPVPMGNVIAKFPGTSGKAIVISGHYDTKRIPMVRFVGANDGGSSTGFLLEFARAVAHAPHTDDYYVVFFDGEEAVGTWTDTDSRYGSRYLVDKWAGDGTLRRIRALVNIDMIGDKDLDILTEGNSSATLRSTVLAIAAKLGDSKYFREGGGGIDDDHKPFVDAGVNAIDLIDLDYGPNNSYWHTAEDTMDKLSASSLQVGGDVVLELCRQLQQSS